MCEEFLAKARRWGVLLLITLANAGCASVSTPCIEYATENFLRTVNMRGYGTVQYTEQALVCAAYAGLPERREDTVRVEG